MRPAGRLTSLCLPHAARFFSHGAVQTKRSRIVLAGATGQLGFDIAEGLTQRGADVTALIRPLGSNRNVDVLRGMGVKTVNVDFKDVGDVAKACEHADCVVSALAGLREVVVDHQTTLVDAAIMAGVPRFIPSDFTIDFTKLPDGSNRNLDFRREFLRRLDGKDIKVTSILCGAFMDLLADPNVPFILHKPGRTLCWGSADQALEFTTRSNVGHFTAEAALDASTPRFLYIVGDKVSARDLAAIASELSGRHFTPLRPGGLRLFELLIRVTRLVAPGAADELYPAWQGMQYMHNQLSGVAEMGVLDNARYASMQWTSVRAFLEEAAVFAQR